MGSAMVDWFDTCLISQTVKKYAHTKSWLTVPVSIHCDSVSLIWCNGTALAPTDLCGQFKLVTLSEAEEHALLFDHVRVGPHSHHKETVPQVV